MIYSPLYGWCNFKIADFLGTPSYITEVPLDLLTCFINYFKTYAAAITLDEEGSQFTLVLSYGNVYIISERDRTELYTFDGLLIEDLAKELIEDIKNNICNWANFLTLESDESNYIEVQESKINELQILIDELQSLTKRSS